MKRLFFAILLLAVTAGAVRAQGQSEGMRKLSLADFAITNLYVDEVDEAKLVEDGIRGMLEKLDPHSTYTTAEETKEMNEPLQGNFSGMHSVQHEPRHAVCDTDHRGGPLEKVGILAGDRIVSVNDTVIAGVKMKNTDIMKRLRGEAGTVVRVSVLRKGVKEPIEFRIVRDKIPIYSIDASYMADKETGYIRVSRFAATTDKEFFRCAQGIEKEGYEKPYCRPSGNGGGYLVSAIGMADEFLDDGQSIVYTEGRRSPRDDAFATKQGLVPERETGAAGR